MANREAKMNDVVSYRDALGSTTDVVVTGLQPALPAQANFTVTPSASGGTLADGTYSYKVAVVVDGVTSPANATAKTGVVAASGGAGRNVIDFTAGLAAYPTATAWKVYGRTGGTELLIATITAPTATYNDTGAVTPAGALPTDTNAVRFRNRGTKATQVDIPMATTTKQAGAYFNR